MRTDEGKFRRAAGWVKNWQIDGRAAFVCYTDLLPDA